MRVMVFELNYSGHLFTHVRLLVNGLWNMGIKPILITGSRSPASDEFQAQLSPVADRFELDATFALHTARPLRIAMDKVFALRRAIRRYRPDHVYIPAGDGLTPLLGTLARMGVRTLRRGIEIETLLLRGGFAYPQTGVASKLQAAVTLKALAASPFTRLHHLDPIPYEVICRRGGALAARSDLMPDPVTPPPPMDRATARRKLGLAADGRYLGCAGLLDERKGIDRLIRAFAAGKFSASDRLLLLGRPRPAIRALLDQDCAGLVRQGRIVHFDRYVSDEELDAGMAAMDLVCVLYPRHIGSVSFAIRAAAAGRPVLASDFGWLGKVVPQFGLGWTCRVTDERQLPGALAASLDAAAEFHLPEAGRRFVEFHTSDNFVAVWTARLRQRLGLPEAAGVKRWAWVEQASSN